MTHLNKLSKVYLEQISEALTPEQRAAAQEILNKESGADKKKAEMKAKKKRSEVRKEKELELKQANLEIRKRREDRRDQGAKDREKNKVDQEKRDALKIKQRDLAKKVGEKSKAAAGASKAAKASLASVKPKETITDKDGDGTALGKLGANAVRGVAGVAGATLNTVKSIRLRQQAKKTQGTLDKTKVQEDTLVEVDEMDSKDKKADKVIDVMRGKNKVEVNPKLKAEEVEMEGVVDMVKKGAKRHSKAIEKRKIKNRKAVPYAALGASYEPEGEMIEAAGCETKKVENKGKKKIDPNKNPVVEAKVDKGRSDYGKASIRNYRRMGPGHDTPAMFEPENKRGKTIEKRREEHKARRGVKGAKVPAYKVDEGVGISSAVMMDKAKKEAILRKKERDAVNKKLKLAKEEVKRDEYGDLVGGPKISKKQKEKNLKSNTPDEQHTTTTSEGSSYGLYKGSGKPSGPMAAFAKKDKDKKKKKVKEDVTIQDAKGRDFLEIIDIVKPQPMKSPKNTVQWTEEKIAKLMKKANEKKRKNALQINKIVGTQ